LSGNAVVFSQPVERFYDKLPPPPSDLDECLVILFIGSRPPTENDFKRTPLLVRKHKVLAALEWLILNHIDYADLTISHENLKLYPDDSPPVAVVHRCADGQVEAEAQASFEADGDRGTEVGPCPFAVQGLTGAEVATMTHDVRVAIAVKHLKENNPVLVYGHSDRPDSTYNNPSLFPSMFPWLFPYGLGGFGNILQVRKINHAGHIKWVVMYHDR
ncbi:hypothetical protein CERSUDRAFT_35758, partial [Gelatoporia subvermispora B]